MIDMTTPIHVKEAAAIYQNAYEKAFPLQLDREYPKTRHIRGLKAVIESILLKHLPQPSDWVDVRDRQNEPPHNVVVEIWTWWGMDGADGAYRMYAKYDAERVYKEERGQWGNVPPVNIITKYTVTHYRLLPQPPAQKEKA